MELHVSPFAVERPYKFNRTSMRSDTWQKSQPREHGSQRDGRSIFCLVSCVEIWEQAADLDQGISIGNWGNGDRDDMLNMVH